MNIPSRIDISVIRKVDDELKEVNLNLPYEYNFNATNAYRKKHGIEYSDFVVRFQGLSEGKFEANEAVGDLLLHAIKEGHRICFEEMPELSLEDIQRYLNSNPEVFKKVLEMMQENMEQPDDEKKNQKAKVK